MCEQPEYVPVSLAIRLTVGELEQLRERSLLAGHRVQARADTLSHRIAFAERFALAGPVDRPQRDHAKPEPCADADTDACGNAGDVTLEWPHGKEACEEDRREAAASRESDRASRRSPRGAILRGCRNGDRDDVGGDERRIGGVSGHRRPSGA